VVKISNPNSDPAIKISVNHKKSFSKKTGEKIMGVRLHCTGLSTTQYICEEDDIRALFESGLKRGRVKSVK